MSGLTLSPEQISSDTTNVPTSEFSQSTERIIVPWDKLRTEFEGAQIASDQPAVELPSISTPENQNSQGEVQPVTPDFSPDTSVISQPVVIPTSEVDRGHQSNFSQENLILNAQKSPSDDNLVRLSHGAITSNEYPSEEL